MKSPGRKTSNTSLVRIEVMNAASALAKKGTTLTNSWQLKFTTSCGVEKYLQLVLLHVASNLPLLVLVTAH